MSGARWRLTGREFAALWERTGFDELPHPISYYGNAPTWDDYRSEMDAARRSLEARADRRLDQVAPMIADAQVRVEVLGMVRVPRPMVVRILGARRGGDGVVLAQLPGATDDVGADVLVWTCAAEEMARRVVQLLPSADPGRQRPLRVSPAELQEQPDEDERARSYLVSAGAEPTERARWRRFLSAPCDGMGDLIVSHGVGLGRRSEAVQYVDHSDDGRYLLRLGQMVTVGAASRPQIAESVEGMVARVLDGQVVRG
ncbi:ESX secretion-associated protein EspG [Rhodococcus sp. D2-41]|uniref:ESX secretion-associated protein EspG n=1 Tax=Speluncibacter jeojiensis TaxID=2710754 RepID=A0A9X4M3W1_9ACTN|nr:ESX secretion-associated protein EspG [Rhodococcus sp. D2-41]MDG3011312.1 ESX secretion-associated protein EspG [Rhodococcus sp. D2-41]MDG3016676.1 ESX secretion-associated protein EspG [Corynebacteriales bacterium D3-21]